MRKILVVKDYIMLKSGSLEFFVGRRHFRLLKAAMEEVEQMRDGRVKEINAEIDDSSKSSANSVH